MAWHLIDSFSLARMPTVSSSDRKFVNGLLENLFLEASQQNIPEDVVGRLLVSAAIGLWRNNRTVDDIASELSFIVENLDADLEYPFMRP